MSSTEREHQIHPLVPESILHNGKVISNLQSLSASLFGVTAGVLGLESYYGFLVYFVLSIITAVLFYTIQIAPSSLAEGRAALDVRRYYHGAFDFWASGLLNGLSGFVLTWTLFYGLVRA